MAEGREEGSRSIPKWGDLWSNSREGSGKHILPVILPERASLPGEQISPEKRLSEGGRGPPRKGPMRKAREAVKIGWACGGSQRDFRGSSEGSIRAFFGGAVEGSAGGVGSGSSG